MTGRSPTEVLQRLLLRTTGLVTASAVVSLCLAHAELAAAEEPPPGYSSAALIKLAVATGQLPLVNRDLPVPDTIEITRGIKYGKGGEVPLLLDLYAPKDLKQDVAGLVLIHGGGWKGGKREDYHYYCVRFAEQGYVVATISYRLRNVARYPAAVEDAKCAVRWLRQHAAQYHVDPNRIGVAGGSAGGHLSMMVGYSADVAELEGRGGHPDVSSRVQAVVNLYGPVDLTTPYARSHDLVTSFIGEPFDEAADRYRQASPLTHISEDDPPTLTFHGTLDDLVPIAQADTLDQQLKRHGILSRYERLEGWPHAMDMAQVVNDYCLRRMLTFLDEQLGPAKQAAGPDSTKVTARDTVAEPRLQPIVLSEEFYSEGATFADIDGDGQQDVVSGPFWYAGPDFRRRTAYTTAAPVAISDYSQHFFTFAADFNADQRPDILAIPIPGAAAHWFQNPGPDGGEWKKHLVLSEVSNESPDFADITGDGQPELVCIHNGAYGYTTPDPADATRPWGFTAVTDNRGYGRFTHGMGVGDVNGDSRPDLLGTNGWWEQTATPGELFQFHAFPFAESGGAQMFAYDFDGDGDSDIVSVQNAHGWGLKWFEQRGSDDEVGFIAHEILPNAYDANGKLNISQMHSLAVADIDGDGIKDLITGKRFYAHGGNDPGAYQLPVLYWFRTIRGGPELYFEPHLIDERTGVGTQLMVGDVSGNGRPDIVIGNKLGTSVVLNHGGDVPPRHLSKLMQQIGSQEYAQTIRTTEPLSPDDERATFVLPAGFEAQLVVAEPEIAKPMNLAFDSRGRLWITSSEEYPYAAPQDRMGKDKIVVLEDRDGDGHRETVTTFADELNIPIGLYPYKDGVICYSIPNIWFLRDTDGDGTADKREKLYGPMGFERDTHGMCNGFTRGYDGWLYACHGFNNHTTVAGTDGHQITMQSGNTFRMRLDGSRVEHFTHGLVNPFGMSQSTTGDLFVADCHTKPISLLLRGGYYDSFGKPHDGLGYVPNVMDHLHGSTAIGGIAQYNSDVFPDIYHGNTFGGNVMTGRINRNSLQPHGSSFRAREQPDLLICGDPWFRPVDLQVGPDGALYVADFYNRIIGHYEVKLDHPGRDRQRGRVWKIVYSGGDSRRDAGAVPPRQHPVVADAPDRLFAQLASSDQTTRMLATDRLTDEFPLAAAPLALQGLLHNQAEVRVHSLWILQRLGQLSDDDLITAFSDPSELVRVHAFRIMQDRSEIISESPQHLRRGLEDTSGLVRRAAVQAAGEKPDATLIRPLLSLYHETAAADVHLRHAIKMALRNHLRDENAFREFAATVAPGDVSLVAGICLALNSPAAGEFIVRHIRSLSDSEPQLFADYLRFAVRYVNADTVEGLTSVARERFQSDQDFQLALLQAAQEGLRQRGTETPVAIRNWARDLASDLLGLIDGRLPAADEDVIAWHYAPFPGTQDRGNPFVTTLRRTSVDGMQNTPLISSIPHGEQWTGIYRSDSFTCPAEFSFYMAGHDGFPNESAKRANLVRLRDAVTHEVLEEWPPPRNDTAHRFVTTQPHLESRRVYVEIVDGDTASAYAWLAVGRFSVPGLNQGESTAQRRKGAELVRNFQLTERRDVIAELLRRGGSDREFLTLLAETLVSMRPDSRLHALAAAIGIAGLTAEQSRLARETLIAGAAANAADMIGNAMKVATSAEQLKVALALSVDVQGAELLVSLAEKGMAAAELLQRPVVSDPIKALNNAELTQRVADLVRNLPDVNAAADVLISQRKQQYRQHTGNASKGEALFTKNCAVCHQVAGKGKQVGPNLDGIGSRGLDRLVEDMLAPNRNVDVAFRSTSVVLTSGKVASGLSKGFDGASLILVDSKGERQSLPRDQIEEQVVSSRSPMPDNVAEVLTEEQFRDLVAWLLSLRK